MFTDYLVRALVPELTSCSASELHVLQALPLLLVYVGLHQKVEVPEFVDREGRPTVVSGFAHQ